MAKPYNGPEDETCPYMLGELCKKTCPTCARFQLFSGKDPVTGETINGYSCEISMQTRLLIQLCSHTFQTGAAIESFRNETLKQSEGLIHGTAIIAARALQAVEDRGEVLQIEGPQTTRPRGA